MSGIVEIPQADGRRWMVHDRVLYGADPEVATWVQVRLGSELVETQYVALGILKSGIDPATMSPETLPTSLSGGTYFWGWRRPPQPTDIWVAVAIDDNDGVDLQVVKRILTYPFLVEKIDRISAEIALDNDRAVRQAKKLGFRLEGEKRGTGFGYFGLLRSECPFWTRGEAA